MITEEVLRQYPFFSALTDAQRQKISSLAEEVHFRKGEAIFHQGQSADALYVLMDGLVTLHHNVREEDVGRVRTAEELELLMETGVDSPMLEGQTDLFKEYTVGHVRQEEIVGISALVEPYHLTATARVAEASRLIKIDAPTLRQLCRDDPHLGYRLMSAMAKTALERLHSTRQQLAYT